MSDPFAKVVPGQKVRPRADFHNATIDAILATRGMVSAGGAQTVSGLKPGQIYVRNDSGADREWYDVLAITGLAITPEDNEAQFLTGPILSAGLPVYVSEWAHFGKFVVLTEPIRTGAIGRAWINGTFPAWVTGEGSHADIAGTEHGSLRAAPFGHAKILVDPLGGEEERWVLVRAVDPQLCWLGRALADIDSGGTGTVRVLRGPRPGVVRSPVLDVTGVYNGGPLVNEDAVIEVKWINENWEIGDGECPVIEE